MGIEQLPDEDVKEQNDERVVFVFGGAILFTAIILLVNWWGATGPISEKTVEGSFGIIELLILGFLFTKTVDRSEILTNVGKGLRNYGSLARRTQLTDGRDPEDSRPAPPFNKEQENYG